jgi:hypothetical protein
MQYKAKVGWCHGKALLAVNNKSLLSPRLVGADNVTMRFIIPCLDHRHHRHHRHIALQPFQLAVPTFQLAAPVPRLHTAYLERVARVIGCYNTESCTSFPRMVLRGSSPTLIRDTVADQNDCTTSPDLLHFAERCTYSKESTDTCKQSFCRRKGDFARSLLMSRQMACTAHDNA